MCGIASMPSWFIIVDQWRKNGMGEYGVTLPFLVGALAYEKRQETACLDDVLALLTELIENPVDGYMTLIRWCGDIDEPVISMKALNDPFQVAIKDGYLNPHGDGFSLAFTEDLMSMFNLDCRTADECRAKLANYAKSYAEKGLFSKRLNPETQNREFCRFSQRDIDYLGKVVPNLAWNLGST